MSHCIYISLYAAIEAHRAEFESSVKEVLFNALKNMSRSDIKNAFSPVACEKVTAKIAA